jgi:hypothetical protein
MERVGIAGGVVSGDKRRVRRVEFPNFVNILVLEIQELLYCPRGALILVVTT